MPFISQVFFFFLLIPSLLISEILFGDIKEVSIRRLELSECLLPEDHPLQKKLKNLFEHNDMFKTRKHFRQAGFRAYSHRDNKIIVASHPAIKKFLIKKFSDIVPQKMQLDNYIKRISGGRALRQFILVNGLKHLVVPQKWLYPLPEHFSDLETGERTYVLIVENMNICRGDGKFSAETAKRYAAIENDTLRELCIAVYYFRGLDSAPCNLPFTLTNKIAFVDTERFDDWDRAGFLRRILPYINQRRQKEVLAIFEELCAQDKREVICKECPSLR